MDLRHLLGGLCLALSLALHPPPARAADSAAQVRAVITQARHPALKRPDFAPLRGEMQRFYEPRGYGLAWFRDGRPRPEVADILAALRAADARGLTPGDYDVIWLDKAWKEPREGDGAHLALLDTALSVALFRYLSDVHTGRVNPASVEFQVDIQPKKLDLAGRVRDALASGELARALAEAEPPYPMYRRLRDALERYRALAAQALPLPLPPPASRKVEPGQAYAGTDELRRLLTAYGDLPPDAPAGPPGVYDAALARGVTRFQERHGLAPDGVLGKATFPALNVPPAARARQIELALERMRWLPEPPAGPAIGINIPEFKLRVFEPDAGRLATRFRLDVVVGKSLDTRTPVFAGLMEYVVFSPYWNVPPSIARSEIIPAMRKDPGYLAAHDMELVGSATAEPVDAAPNEGTLEAIRTGALRVRQRPGERNPLGGVKFVFPNAMDVYLHDTPAQSLFRRPRRDFSHGCIRVSDAPRLARFVLRDMPEWNEQRIEAAMKAGKELHVRLGKPIPVVVFYTTVIVEEDGLVRFLPDIYGHDRALDLALKALYPK